MTSSIFGRRRGACLTLVSTVLTTIKRIQGQRILAGTIFFLTAGTALPDTPPELVLGEHVRLSATTPSGVITVYAGDGIDRTYEWNGCTFESTSMSMSPRHERWFGAKGIRGEGDRGIFNSLFGCKGVSRPLFSESQLHFPSTTAAQAWLDRYAVIFDTVWTKDGLVVQWGVSPERYQINVELRQICIRGKRPDQLAGASEESIQVTRASGSGAVRQDCVQVGSAIEQQTERTWDAHWKQSDFMNAPYGKPTFPAAPTISSLDAGQYGPVSDPQRIERFIGELGKLRRWKRAPAESPTPQAAVGMIDSAGRHLCTVWLRSDSLWTRCGLPEASPLLLAPLTRDRARQFKDLVGGQWDIE